MSRGSTRTPVSRLDVAAGTRTSRPDALAAEEPLEVRVDGAPVVVTMRTPGDDIDLAIGFLLTEGLLRGVDDVAQALLCAGRSPGGEVVENVLQVTLRPGAPAPDLEGRRTFGMTSACGVCGSASIDAVERRSSYDVGPDPLVVGAGVLASLPERLREAQRVFSRTGGLHAAGLFTPDGELLAAAEDVGRHNAVDKVLGRAARERLGAGRGEHGPGGGAGGWPLRGTVLQVSGRASFELAQKAWAAGVPVLSAVSAPSSLAVDVARRAGMTLAGFVRDPRLNLYAGEHRVVVGAAAGGARPAQQQARSGEGDQQHQRPVAAPA